MNRKKTEEVLKRELDRLMPITAWQHDNSIHLFGRYQINSTDTGYSVIKNGDEVGRFKSRRFATIWCTADYCGDRKLAYDIKQYDRIAHRTHNDISVRRSLAGSAEFKELVGTKLERKQQILKELEHEVNRCVRLAKQYQRGIANETIRVCSA